jgi:hypothetical protein
MAQANSVPSSTRQLITGGSANQSTKLPAVKIKPSDRDYFIGQSVMRSDEAAHLLRHCREKHGGVEPEEGLLNRRWYEANTGQEPMGSNIGAHFDPTAAFFLGRRLRKIVQILLLFVSRNKRLRNGAFDKMSSNQLVRSRPQERLR